MRAQLDILVSNKLFQPICLMQDNNMDDYMYIHRYGIKSLGKFAFVVVILV